MGRGRRWLFPLTVLAVNLLVWFQSPEKALSAFRASLTLALHILPSLGLVFVLMTVLNLFIKPLRLTGMARKGPSPGRMFFAAGAGILSTGPIFAWYPMLKELREKGAAQSLLAVFLVNRAVKPFLLPIMVAMFGWPYVFALLILTVAGSFALGWIVALTAGPSSSKSPSSF